MENWQLALVVIAAIFTGATLPMIMQWRSTLASVDRLVRSNEADVRRTLVELSELTHHLNRLSREVDGNAKHVRSLLESIAGVTDSVRSVGGSFRTASMLASVLGPAITSAIRAFQGGAGPGGGLVPLGEEPYEGADDADAESAHAPWQAADGVPPAVKEEAR